MHILDVIMSDGWSDCRYMHLKFYTIYPSTPDKLRNKRVQLVFITSIYEFTLGNISLMHFFKKIAVATSIELGTSMDRQLSHCCLLSFSIVDFTDYWEEAFSIA